MAIPDRIINAYAVYLSGMDEAARQRRPIDGFLGFGWGKAEKLQDAFADELRSAVEEYAAAGPLSAEAAETLRFMYSQAHSVEDRTSGAYWMLLASHSFSLPLVEALDSQDARSLREFYESEFPKRERFPAQNNVIKALKAREKT